jgi:hypothetical protein
MVQIPLLGFIIFKVVLFGIIPAILIPQNIIIFIHYLSFSLLNRCTTIRSRLGRSRIVASI